MSTLSDIEKTIILSALVLLKRHILERIEVNVAIKGEWPEEIEQEQMSLFSERDTTIRLIDLIGGPHKITIS